MDEDEYTGVAVGERAINEKWPRGLAVRVISGYLAGRIGTVRSNRIYASDCGAWVDLGGDEGVGLVHWTELEAVR